MKKPKIEIQAFQFIERSREYLASLETYTRNVEKAFLLVDKKCSDMDFIWDDSKWHSLKTSVECHDLSKFSVHEFVQYRQKFYPTELEQGGGNNCPLLPKALIHEDIDDNFKIAFNHHIKNNQHHWQNWHEGNSEIEKYYYYEVIECVHMVIDWIAMGLGFNSTAQEYYEKNKADINIPDWAEKLINEIFEKVYPITEEDLEYCKPHN